MKILNLVYPEKSDIKYKPIKFPDGQQNINIYDSPFNLDFINHQVNNVVQIKSRLNNFQDLELIICTVKSLRNLGVKEIHLYTPYFLGSRSDRQFEDGGNNYLKDVICPIINSLNLSSIIVLDAHSYVLEACLNNFKKVDNLELVKWSIEYQSQSGLVDNPLKDFILISPDAGASHKIYKLADKIGLKEDIITCSKERDENGKLTKCIVPYHVSHLNANKDIIIIDDICDGGNTFINIAKELKGKTLGKIYLVVTHGIFSKGLTELSVYFDGIYCTNSYSDQTGKEGMIFKQLNIF